MKERGILFSAPMVRALLDGTKTQTRRALQSPESITSYRHFEGIRWDRMEGSVRGDSINCRYGQPGDRLWVRETWMADPPIDDSWPSTQFAGCKPRDHSLIPDAYKSPKHCLYRASMEPDFLTGWTPAIHMFRWASRLTLEVVVIRVERLLDISEADAVAEGVQWSEAMGGYHVDDGRHFHCTNPKESYFSLWETINGSGSVEANPWVWVVEFRAATEPPAALRED